MTNKLIGVLEDATLEVNVTISEAGPRGLQGIQGPKGDKGEQGEKGTDGKDGHTPQKGVDYYTDDDKAEMVSAVISALPMAEGVGF